MSRKCAFHTSAESKLPTFLKIVVNSLTKPPLSLYMASNLLLDLHGGKQLPESFRQNTLMQNLGEKFIDLKSQLNNLLAALPTTVHSNYFNLRKRIGSKLVNSRKKYRLALESLGWGTLADILDSAFCGEILNIIA